MAQRPIVRLRRFRLWLRLLLVIASAIAATLPLAGQPAAAGTEPTTGTVVGTDAVNVRRCSDVSCDVVAVAPLGATLDVTGRPEDGFLPVRYDGTAGYAYALYVRQAGAPTPYLMQGRPGCARVALIFDIGIGDEPATGILDTLLADGVPATMFVMGAWAETHPTLLQQIAADGFVIGSHGDQAIEPTKLSDAALAAALHAAADAIAEAIGRPPGPWYTAYAAASDDRVRGIAAANGYLPVAWAVPADDYGPDATAEHVYHRVVDNIADGAIVEMHLDGPASATSTGVALPGIIATLRAQGYHFVTVPEMADPCGDG